ncbi:universal stress protein [Streptomyces mirabilis]|uniref:universal stress protein n=1 Tax=Streptomyces mirabilis TaxID=68239 RepID=UPI003323F9C6
MRPRTPERAWLSWLPRNTMTGQCACPATMTLRSLLGAGAPSAGMEAARFAFPEAEARKCTLDVVRAWRRPSDETTHDPLLAGEPEGRQSSGHRNCSTPCSASADLVVVGARRRHGHFGLRLGRAGHTVLHHAECPAAIVPRSK